MRNATGLVGREFRIELGKDIHDQEFQLLGNKEKVDNYFRYRRPKDADIFGSKRYGHQCE